MPQFLNQLLGFLVLLAVVLGARYYYYVEYEDSPYSEIGGGLHNIMPQHIQDWGCARLRNRFPEQTPSGC